MSAGEQKVSDVREHSQGSQRQQSSRKVREKYSQAIGKCAGEAASACDLLDRGVSEPAAGPRHRRVICGIREKGVGTGRL